VEQCTQLVLDTLEQSLDAGLAPASISRHDSFQSLWHEPRFKKLMSL
jgi:hypothetical protein